MVYGREGGDGRGCCEVPGLGGWVVGLRCYGGGGVEGDAAGGDVLVEDFGEAWRDAAAASGFFEHFGAF